MAAFNFSKFADSVMDAAVMAANQRIDRNVSDLLGRIGRCIQQMINHAKWINRNYNLITSFAGMLFYNGELVGKGRFGIKGTTGAVITARRRDPAARGTGKDKRIYTKLPNPVLSHEIIGREKRPWRWAVLHDASPRTGRGFATQAVKAAAKRAKGHEGYYVVIVVAMPYASSKGLADKVMSVLDCAKEIYGGGFFKMIRIDTGMGGFDY